MTEFTIHNEQSAPEAAKPILQTIQQNIGFVPNLFGVFAGEPAVAEAYASLNAIFAKTSLTAEERNVVLLSISRDNDCTYCVAAHSTIAAMNQVDESIIEAIRNGQPLADAKLQALCVFARTVIEKKGFADDADVNAFLAAGYSNEHILAVILAVSFKVLSTYTNHIAHTPLDAQFSPKAWESNKAA